MVIGHSSERFDAVTRNSFKSLLYITAEHGFVCSVCFSLLPDTVNTALHSASRQWTVVGVEIRNFLDASMMLWRGRALIFHQEVLQMKRMGVETTA